MFDREEGARGCVHIQLKAQIGVNQAEVDAGVNAVLREQGTAGERSSTEGVRADAEPAGGEVAAPDAEDEDYAGGVGAQADQAGEGDPETARV